MKPMTPDELRAWRLSLELSQKEAARRTGYSERSWRNWEAGTHPIPAILTRLRVVDPKLRNIFPEKRSTAS